ncbi:hypothetical protein F2Q69_00044690 [Brassica cretica]|uniref:GPI ethanolamine phosphate transferase 2 C-terminal domain-containing protein n=1 Tax=Brassica cretica TaxID=69181 RepID=A0A8S9NM86_BRACR|nr:hypothetical protein F2Q69_00044690 [Brassica cretica]
METHPKRINKWIPLSFLLIHSVAILIFTRGFLLTRTELPFHSTCSDASLSPCLSPNPPIHHSNSNQNQPKCWTKPVVDRVVIIVLDALRIDFLAPSAFFPEAKPWMDKLTVLQNLAFGNESSAKIFKAFADPPTTSLQRLKGLTTGGLPTFVDVGNSFGAPAIVEDNFINQLVLNGKRLVMMGDDTWTQLFPNQFHKSYPFPSFNVKDLDTVDNGCIEHLFPTLYKDDWDVLIAHFLGVDHAGHIFGVDSMPMINKLEQYNTVLERVVDILESQAGPGGVHENTMLIVMGDHGQTLNGDHGGGTAEEVTLTYAIEIAPILSVAALICVLYVAIARTHSEGIWKYVTVGSMLSYFLIALLWASESKIFGFDGLLQVIGGRNIIPQTVYVIGLVQLFLLASAHMFCSGKDKNWGSRTVALVSACSSPVILLSGKQGSMLALAYLLAGYCIMRLEGVERRTKSDGQNKFSKLDSVCVVQWSLLSVCMFFASGHWCAFDGLRYGAAFVGFDEFVLIRQAILLTIETFGFSIILSVFGLPLLIPSHGEKRHQLFQMYMLYGVISATTVTATILCVTIHRRHLMVWGLFAPKFVFDVVGLILTDVLICLASAFYL